MSQNSKYNINYKIIIIIIAAMIVPVKNQDGLSEGLTQLLNEIKCLFYQSSFETTIKHAKRIAKQLVYYLKRIKFSSKQQTHSTNSISQCFKLVTWLVDSSQFTKFGHIFPFCGYVTKIFNCLADKIDKGQYHQSILRRIGKNQASPLYNPNKKWQILAGELHFLKNYRFENLIASLASKKIIFSNLQCVCCSQIFMKGAIVLNNNHIFRTLLGTQSLASQNLEKLLNSIANQNGGVILIGSKKTLSGLKVQGLQFESFQQMSQAQKQIRSSILNIKPECNFQIQKVPVSSHFFQSQELKDKKNLVCFRVQIFPQYQHKITYLEFTSKNKLLYYETYQLNADQIPVEIKFQPGQPSPSTVYTIIHRKYYKGSSRKANSHESILCFQPMPLDPSLLNQNFCDQNTAINKFPNQSEKQYSNQLKFKYPRVSLLIVNSTKDDRQIQTFCKYLEETKIEFQLERVFPDTFKYKPGDRSVWIISHKMTFVNLRTTLSKAQEEGPKIKQVIKAMPVQKTLQIQAAKLTPYSQKIVEKKFKDRYPQGYLTEELQIVDKKKQEKKLVFLTFPDFEQSIYAFMIMQNLNLKPFFTKQGQIYQKK